MGNPLGAIGAGFSRMIGRWPQAVAKGPSVAVGPEGARIAVSELAPSGGASLGRQQDVPQANLAAAARIEQVQSQGVGGEALLGRIASLDSSASSTGTDRETQEPVLQGIQEKVNARAAQYEAEIASVTSVDSPDFARARSDAIAKAGEEVADEFVASDPVKADELAGKSRLINEALQRYNAKKQEDQPAPAEQSYADWLKQTIEGVQPNNSQAKQELAGETADQPHVELTAEQASVSNMLTRLGVEQALVGDPQYLEAFQAAFTNAQLEAVPGKAKIDMTKVAEAVRKNYENKKLVDQTVAAKSEELIGYGASKESANDSRYQQAFQRELIAAQQRQLIEGTKQVDMRDVALRAEQAYQSQLLNEPQQPLVIKQEDALVKVVKKFGISGDQAADPKYQDLFRKTLNSALQGVSGDNKTLDLDRVIGGSALTYVRLDASPSSPSPEAAQPARSEVSLADLLNIPDSKTNESAASVGGVGLGQVGMSEEVKQAATGQAIGLGEVGMEIPSDREPVESAATPREFASVKPAGPGIGEAAVATGGPPVEVVPAAQERNGAGSSAEAQVAVAEGGARAEVDWAAINERFDRMFQRLEQLESKAESNGTMAEKILTELFKNPDWLIALGTRLKNEGAPLPEKEKNAIVELIKMLALAFGLVVTTGSIVNDASKS